MKRMFAVMILSALGAAPILAEGVGVGWEDGLSGRFAAGKATIQGVLNFSQYSADDNATIIPDGAAWSLAGYVSYPIRKIERANLNFFGGFGFQSNPDCDLNVGFRFGLEPHVMVTDHIGVGGKVGFQFISVGGIEDVDDSGGSAFGLWGVTGIHWYF